VPVLAALSLDGLRRALGNAHHDAEVKLVLDRAARHERDRRCRGGEQGRERVWPR
jgi:hypothetical protein